MTAPDPAANALAREARRYRPFSAALHAALAEDPFYRTLAACADDPLEGMLSYYDYSILEAERFGVLCQPGDTPFGISVWSRPLTESMARCKVRDKSAVIADRLGPSALGAYSEISGVMSKAAASIVSEADWYLSILGVLPGQQGRGLGPGLVTPVLARADAVGAASYLETFTPRNIPFYQRLGYDVVGSFRAPVVNSDYWVLRRDAGGRPD